MCKLKDDIQRINNIKWNLWYPRYKKLNFGEGELFIQRVSIVAETK